MTKFTFRLSPGCKGFYTNFGEYDDYNIPNIKILTASHKIELPNDCEDLYRLEVIESRELIYSFEYNLASTSNDEQEALDEHQNYEVDKKQEQLSRETLNSELQSLNSVLNKVTEDLRSTQANRAHEEHELKKINSALVTLVNKQEDTRSGAWHIFSYIKYFREKLEQQNENHDKLISILNSVKYSSWAIVLLLIFILFKL